MQISSNISRQEIKGFQKSFYEYFDTGFAFEEFLKEYLLKMGLDEVEVTQRTRDGGVDLKAIRKGVGDFSDIDITHYYIQAKRYSLANKVSVSKVRELKGTIPFGYKGMMITTSDFTADAVAESGNDPSKPVVLINGEALVMSCIDNQIGFFFKPIFSKKQMDAFLNVTTDKTEENLVVEDNDVSGATIEKLITSNDIRARILSIPSSIMKQFSDDLETIIVIANGKEKYKFKICRGRNYFGGVTSFLRKYNMLSEEGIITPRKSKWVYDSNKQIVFIDIEG